MSVVDTSLRALGSGFTQSSDAKFSVASLGLWTSVQVTSDPLKKRFDGTSWGIAFPGGGYSSGTLHYDDLDRLSSVTSYDVEGTAIYVLVHFKDDTGIVGTYQGLAISTAVGVTTGSGNWVSF